MMIWFWTVTLPLTVNLILKSVFSLEKNKATEILVASQCAGGLIGLSCDPGHRIRVQRDWYGVATDPDSCEYQPGQCRVVNRRHVSVIHRYCEGQQMCSNFLVDRRHCGHNQTTYEQVEYVCIPGECHRIIECI